VKGWVKRIAYEKSVSGHSLAFYLNGELHIQPFEGS